MGDILSLVDKANKLFTAGNITEAIELYQKALESEPENLSVLNTLATAYLTEKNYDESMRFINRALNIDPKSVIANSNLGFIFMEQEKYSEAAKHFVTALEGEPNQAFLWNDLGNAFHKSDNFDAAIECYEKAVKIAPGFVDSYFNLGSIAVKQKKYPEAAKYFAKVISLDPGRIEIYYELAHLYFYEIRDIDRAVYYAKELLALNPEFERAQMILAEIELIKGNLPGGLAIYNKYRHIYIDAKEKNQAYRYFESIPMWRGEIFSGKSLVIGSNAGFGGFGDLIMLSRYLPELKKRGGYVTLPAPTELWRLFERLKDVDEIIPQRESEIFRRKFDLKVPFISLPEIFGSTLNTIPAKVPYLTLAESWINEWKARINNSALLKVGLVWAGNSKITSTLGNRAYKLEYLYQLENIPNVTYYSLQIGEKNLKSNNPEPKLNMVDLTCYIKDFADTAALIQNLDLVISVDTAVAHLAGALNKPVWLMLPAHAEWRWLLDRTDSPWYPDMRIFRSKKIDDWENVIDEVCLNLKELAKKINFSGG